MTDEYGKKSAGAYRTARKQQSDRAEYLIERDRLYGASEAKRKEAESELRKGRFANIEDTVVRPTEEWMRQGGVEKFTPKAPDGTVRSVETVRRVTISAVAKLWAEGKISDELYFAAYWYRCNYDVAGVEGRYKTSSLSGENFGGGSGGAAQHPMAQHEREADARAILRAVRNHLGAASSALFDAVVVNDLPLRAAAREIRCRNGDVLPRFRECCEQVSAWCDLAQIDLDQFVKSRAGA